MLCGVLQGLSGRPDEPSSCAVQFLKSISEYFQFYYSSPDAVLKVGGGSAYQVAIAQQV